MDKTTGLVLERHPNSLFTLQLENGKQIKAYLGGKMRKNRIYIIEGDTVEVQLDKYGSSNRITYRKNIKRI